MGTPSVGTATPKIPSIGMRLKAKHRDRCGDCCSNASWLSQKSLGCDTSIDKAQQRSPVALSSAINAARPIHFGACSADHLPAGSRMGIASSHAVDLYA